jgi:hypothetical protein
MWNRDLLFHLYPMRGQDGRILGASLNKKFAVYLLCHRLAGLARRKRPKQLGDVSIISS